MLLDIIVCVAFENVNVGVAMYQVGRRTDDGGRQGGLKMRTYTLKPSARTPESRNPEKPGFSRPTTYLGDTRLYSVVSFLVLKFS